MDVQDLKLAWDIEELDLRTQTKTLLVTAGIFTVGDLVKLTEAHLDLISRFGPLCLKDVKNKLARHGLSLMPTDYRTIR